MKNNFFFFFSIFGLAVLCFQSEANAPLACHQAFKKDSVKELSPEVEALISHIPYTVSQDVLRLDDHWKSQIKLILPQLKPEQMGHFLDQVLNLTSKNLNWDQEREFFKFLESASLNFIVYFNKNQLIEIMWIWVKLDIKPQDEFISRWRQAASKRKREFTAKDRRGLYGFFKRLGIPSSFAEKK